MKASIIFLIVVITLFSITSCSSPQTNTSSQQHSVLDQIEKLNDGKNLYEENCTACHGSDGKACIANAANLQNSILNIDSLEKIISNGKNTMPAFNEVLKPSQIEKISLYVKTLHK